ncbi:2-amino-3-ketobutyrate coenzyme A ligase [Pseudomonas phage PhiPA3]|uniref:2-amino-3-ketobutyrate coenzyme A ligase n=1 Tax=Pseudomonas phage PhiPA3 TaxID=998086 RepID=F8SJS3_BPPA3|nr:2-amino-3-ketobutyrate coenzyme A ligase [Pseudomonas phage PhiPA3]AEH03468.1 2-amino-3-ketobutyrate coenzyme A ligase [Pseudomonas phage PhiPA3]
MSDLYSFVLQVADLYLSREQIYDEHELVEVFFMGRSEAWDFLKQIEKQLPEIMSFFPDRVQEIRYLRTMDNGVYAIGSYTTDLPTGQS